MPVGQGARWLTKGIRSDALLGTYTYDSSVSYGSETSSDSTTFDVQGTYVNINLLEALTCRDLQDSLPVGETDTFTTDDDYVYAWTAWEGASGSHTIRWESYRPDGTLYGTLPYDFDYSPYSLAFFSEWLKRRYSSLEALNVVWKTDLSSFSEVDPRVHATHNVPFYDWVKFQVDQRREFDHWQYRIAKQAQPDLDAYNLTYGGMYDLNFTEFGYLRSSDGISSGDWYLSDSCKDQPLKMVERAARIALTSGEAFHFPFLCPAITRDGTAK